MARGRGRLKDAVPVDLLVASVHVDAVAKKKYATRLCTQYGVVQKEYVEVPDTLLRNPKELAKFLKISFSHVGELKPKPSAKKMPAGKRQRS